MKQGLTMFGWVPEDDPSKTGKTVSYHPQGFEVETFWQAHRTKLIALLLAAAVGGIWYKGVMDHQKMRVKMDAKQLEAQLKNIDRAGVADIMGGEPTEIIKRPATAEVLRYDTMGFDYNIWDSYKDKYAKTVDVLIDHEGRVFSVNYTHYENGEQPPTGLE